MERVYGNHSLDASPKVSMAISSDNTKERKYLDNVSPFDINQWRLKHHVMTLLLELLKYMSKYRQGN